MMHLLTMLLILVTVAVMPVSAARDYPVYAMDEAPVVDGALEDAAWQDLPEATGLFVCRAGGAGARDGEFAWRKPTSFRIGWDSEALYVAVRCKEPFNHLLDPMRGDGAALWDDNSVEVLVSPDGRGYRQFIVNSAGARWNGRDGRAAPEMWDWRAATSIDGDHWTAEITLPFAVLGDRPAEGDAWRFNIGRNVTIGPEAERYSCWAPVTRGFADVDDFPRMVFSGAPDEAQVREAEQRLNEPFLLFVEDRQEHPANLAVNSTFAGGMASWGRAQQPHRISIDETTSTIGARSLRLDGVLEPGEAPVQVAATQPITLKPGTAYVLRADIKRTKFAGVVSVDVLERDTPAVYWTHHVCGDRATDSDVPGKWGRYEKRFRTSDNLQESLLIIYNRGSDAVAWFDNIQLFEDDGSAEVDTLPRAAKTIVIEVETRDASVTLPVNGEQVAAAPGEPVSMVIREGLSVIAVDAAAEGDNPGVRIRIPRHPETDDRWRVSGRQDVAAAWVTPAFDDRDWPTAAPDDAGFMWAGDGAERTRLRQVILWNRAHDGPDRCINPLIREWGISEGSVETLFTAIYSPFPFAPDDYEFLFDVPAGFRLLDFMHEDGRHVLNTRPSGFTVEETAHNGEPYTRYRISFPEDRIYTAEGRNILSRYLLVPVFLEGWTGDGETTAWHYRRQAKGNFTELQQTVPVRILPPIDGRMLEHIRISQYCSRPWSFSAHPHLSPEHLQQHLNQSFGAGFNTWILPGRAGWDIATDPYTRTVHDRVLAEEHGKLTLWNDYPHYGGMGRDETGRHRDWLEQTPQARGRFWNDTDTWETRGQYCPTYALGEGREALVDMTRENYRIALERLPGATTVWSNCEEAPWAGASIYTTPSDGRRSWCFCDRCKEHFREWAELPADADLSDSNIFSSYRIQWHRFRSHLDGELAAVSRQAANDLGRPYMVYSWTAHRDYWAAMRGNIDRAFTGDPGNGVADGYKQRSLDGNAAFLRNEAGFHRSEVIGQRFSFFAHYSWLPEQDHREFWRKWTVLSPDGYVHPRTWKTQILRVVATYGGGIDLQGSIEYPGGALYWIGEATRILAEYEGIFHGGERADDLAECDALAYPNVLVLRKDGERVVLLFNEGDAPLDVTLRNADLVPGMTATVYGTDIRTDGPTEMRVTIPAQDVAVVHMR